MEAMGKKIFLIIIMLIAYSVITMIVYEFISPATIPLIENNLEISSGYRIWFTTEEKYIHHQGDLSRSAVFGLRFFNRKISPDDFSGVIRQSFVLLGNSHNVEDGSRIELFVIVSKVKI